jgi:hypothetical protein
MPKVTIKNLTPAAVQHIASGGASILAIEPGRIIAEVDASVVGALLDADREARAAAPAPAGPEPVTQVLVRHLKIREVYEVAVDAPGGQEKLSELQIQSHEGGFLVRGPKSCVQRVADADAAVVNDIVALRRAEAAVEYLPADSSERERVAMDAEELKKKLAGRKLA